jgi:hypothetical protein
MSEQPRIRAALQCPQRVAETELDHRPYSCTGVAANNMSGVRRHLTRPPHSRFVKLCPTCNEDFLDSEIFELQHGYDGGLCRYPQAQRKGDAAQLQQWDMLYGKIEALVISEGERQRTL